MAGISYEYRAANPDASHAYLLPPVSKFLEKVPAGASVLDLGCGNGTFLANFRNRQWKLYGSDFSPTGIEVAKQNFPDITWFLADASAPTGDILATAGQVDVIISTEVVEHLYDPRGFLKNANALLKPGGTIILSTPYHGYLKNLMLAITGKMDQHFTVLWDHGHVKFWSVKTLTQALEESGFKNVEFAGSGRLPYLWKSMVLKATKA